MLASLGILTASAIHLPDAVFDSHGAIAAATKLYAERPGAIWQILTAIAAIEVSTLFFKNGQGVAGDLGFDPLNFKAKYGLDDQSKFDIMQLKELKNGRLINQSILFFFSYYSFILLFHNFILSSF